MYEVKELKGIKNSIRISNLEKSEFHEKMSNHLGEGYEESYVKDAIRSRKYAVLHNDNIIGHTLVVENPSGGSLLDDIKKSHPNVAYISSTVVDKNHRNKGIASALRKSLQGTYDALLSRTTEGLSDPSMRKLNVKTGFKPIHTTDSSTLYLWKKET